LENSFGLGDFELLLLLLLIQLSLIKVAILRLILVKVLLLWAMSSVIWVNNIHWFHLAWNIESWSSFKAKLPFLKLNMGHSFKFRSNFLLLNFLSKLGSIFSEAMDVVIGVKVFTLDFFELFICRIGLKNFIVVKFS